MLAWLVDHAHVVYFVLGVIVLGLLVSFWLKRRVRTLFFALVGVALIALFWLLTVIVPTDRKQIEANLWEMALAARDKRSSDLVKHLTRDFVFQGRNRDETGKVAVKHRVDSVNLWEFDWKEVTDTRAEVWFRCVAHGDGGTFLAICRATFVKEGELWKLQRISFHQPVANTNEEIAIPLP
jgi:uncharacterized membrane protein (Fun14 family)